MDPNTVRTYLEEQGLLEDNVEDFDVDEFDDDSDDEEEYDDDDEDYDEYENYEDNAGETGFYTQVMPNNAQDIVQVSSGYFSGSISSSHSQELALGIDNFNGAIGYEQPAYLIDYPQQNMDAGYNSPPPGMYEAPLHFNNQQGLFHDSPVQFDAQTAQYNNWPALLGDQQDAGLSSGAGLCSGWQSSDAVRGVAGPPPNMAAFTPEVHLFRSLRSTLLSCMM